MIEVFDPVKKKTIKSKGYSKRTVGDQPELMPLDASLNWDIDTSLNMHVLLTTHLDRNHKDKFCKDTPMEISKAITKLCYPEIGVMPNSKKNYTRL